MMQEFSAWREGLIFYLPPFLLGCMLWGCALGGFLPIVPKPVLLATGALFILVGLAIAAFFRDFPRAITAAANEVVSPADGTVVGIDLLEHSPYCEGPCTRISIFLSVLNAHVNRAPYDGLVRKIEYQRGAFHDARKPETSTLNEANTLYLETAQGLMVVRQIAGAVARRIVCMARAGDTLRKGQKFGMIRFGSRTELYLPDNAEVCVTLNQKVYAGTSVLARFTKQNK
jgi:phosphatidylserine decarboxylase